jgi:glycosyltransferase involved in cell wall biosynthesis
MSDTTRPRVCVVMPAHQSASTLLRAARSVLRQTFPDFVLGIGVRPTDTETLEAVHRIDDPRVKLVIADGASISNARNCVIRAVPADLYMFLDSDDEYASDDVIETYVRDVEAAPDPSLRYGDWIAVSPIDGSRRPRRAFTPSSRQRDLLLLENFVATGTAMVPAEILDEVGLFDDRYPHGEDWDLWLRIARRYPLRHVPIVAFLYTRPKLGRIYPRSHFANEWSIASRQPVGTAMRTIASLVAHGRYAAYFLATVRKRSRRELLDVGLLDLIGLPAAAAVRLTRWSGVVA